MGFQVDADWLILDQSDSLMQKPTLALDPSKVDHYLLHTVSLVHEVFVHSGVQSFV